MEDGSRVIPRFFDLASKLKVGPFTQYKRIRAGRVMSLHLALPTLVYRAGLGFRWNGCNGKEDSRVVGAQWSWNQDHARGHSGDSIQRRASRTEPWDTAAPKGPVENKKPKKVTEKRVREMEEHGESCATEIKSKREHQSTSVLSLIRG